MRDETATRQTAMEVILPIRGAKTNLTNDVRKPVPKRLIAEARVFKAGIKDETKVYAESGVEVYHQA